MCVLILSDTFSEIFLILRRIHCDIIVNKHGYLCKLGLVFSEFKET